MSYVYRYVDNADDTVKYVGLSKDYTSFKRRIEAHKNDDWYPSGDWRIQYIETKNMAEADALETHFINAYETGRYFNKAKVGKGVLSFVPEVTWRDYEPDSEVSGYEQFQREVMDISSELDVLNERISRIYDRAWYYAQDERKAKRDSVREFFWRVFMPARECPGLPGQRFGFNDVFAVYCDYDWEPEKFRAYSFDDVNDFIEALADCYDIRYFVLKDGISGVRVKADPEVVEHMNSQEQKAVESLAKIVYGGAENE